MPSFERFSKSGLVMIVVSLTSYLSLPRRLGGTDMKSPSHDVALTRKVENVALDRRSGVALFDWENDMYLLNTKVVLGRTK